MLGFQALGRLALGQIGSAPAVAADVGEFTFTGISAGLNQGLTAGTGAFVFTGIDAELESSATYSVTGNVGAFTLTGNDSGLDIAFPISAGEFLLSGQVVGLNLSLLGAVGAFTLSGQALTLARDLVLYATPEVTTGYTSFFGFAALGEVAFGESAIDEELANTFALTGQNSTGDRVALLPADAGSYVVSGVVVDFISDAYPSKIRVFPSAGRGARASARGGQPIRVFASTGHGARRQAFGG